MPDWAMFRRYARKQFMAQFPNCKESRMNEQRCYVNVAIRQEQPAAPIPVALPLAVPLPPKPTEHGRVYVGCSRHVDQRIAQHLSGLGSAFTRMFKPTGVRLPRLGNLSGNGDGPERDETLRYMVQRGTRLVRGWKYTLVDMRQADLIDAEANIRELSDLCRRCGHLGHFVADCRMAFDRLGNRLV